MKRGLGILGAVLAVAVASAIALVFALEPPPPLALSPDGVLLRDVQLVLPGEDGWRRPHQRITIENGVIADIEPTRPGDRDMFSGHTVIPGLSDLHVHLPPSTIPGQTELFALLLLRHGVTTIRDAGDVDGTSSGPALSGIAGGAFPGPRIAACGPYVDGEPPLWDNSIVVRTPEEGREAVRTVVASGFDCIKAYNELDASSLAGIRAEARRLGVPVIGHVPKRVPFELALLDDVQHLTGLVPPFDGPRPDFPYVLRGWLRMDPGWRDLRTAQSLELDIAHTPTLVVIERMLAARDYERLRQSRDAQLLPRFYRDVIWNPLDGMSPARGLGPADFDWLADAFASMKRTVKAFHDAGVRLHTGTDTLVAFVVPGAALHRELRLWVEAGISPTEALAASSRDSAAFLGVPGLGTLEVGAPAELAVFSEDPTRSLDALDTLSGVVRGGRLYTRAQLDAQLARYRAHFEGALYDSVMTPVVRRALRSLLPEQDRAPTD
ncbi:MAG: amidohydrolase family protein [Myxococcota bacterium]